MRSDEQYDADDVNALESALLETFGSMDQDIANPEFWRDGPVNIYGIQDFLSRFQAPMGGSGPDDAGFIFTLNQDLMLERNWYNYDRGFPPCHPGVRPSLAMSQSGRQWFSTHVGAYDQVFETMIPADVQLELANRTNYIKLHGSVNWRTADGTRALVIGTAKKDQITSFPLLAAYSEIFERVLMTRGRRLMVTGYSFTDEHINCVIAKAARESELEIHIWDPYVHDLLKVIGARGDCKGILDRFFGPWPQRFHEVFPGNQAKTSEWREMQDKFFRP